VVRFRESNTRRICVGQRNSWIGSPTQAIGREDNRTRRLVVGQYGVLTVERAREMARERLVEVIKGEDPSAERKAARIAYTVEGPLSLIPSGGGDWSLAQPKAQTDQGIDTDKRQDVYRKTHCALDWASRVGRVHTFGCSEFPRRHRLW
jgi:Arm DNA-binding domain